MVFSGDPGVTGEANPPTSLRKGMNMFLKEMAVTFRRDSATRRPRVNKEDSKMDTFQKQIGEYYYTRTKPETTKK
jgi:ATP-binding cassette subfamily E protein 1